MITFYKDYLGTEKNLTICQNRRISWETGWSKYTVGTDSHTDLLNILPLYGPALPPILPMKYSVMAEVLNTPHVAKIIDRRVYLRHLKEYMNAALDRIYDVLEAPYFEMWYRSRKILDILEQPNICMDAFMDIQSTTPPAQHKKLHTLLPTKGSRKIPQIRFKQNATKTGRLTVGSGPNILTMPSEWKKIADQAKQIDFVSMEPMLLAKISGLNPPNDIYTWIGKELNLKLSRTKIKILVITSMYGGQDNKTTKKIDELLQIPEWIEKIKAGRKENRIFNYFGRPIPVDEEKGRHMFALWLQSSAVDAALMGFTNFVNKTNVSPHWIIHDGLVFTGDINHTTSIFINDDLKLPVLVEKVS